MSISRGTFLVAILVGWGVADLAAAQPKSDAMNRGAVIYSQLCTTCHGRYGRADGPLASNLQVRPPDFTDFAWFAGRSDDEILAGLVGRSHKCMAVAAILKEEALHDAVAYLRRLSVPGKHVSLVQGRDIYQASCWVCHGRDGDGRGPAVQHLPGNQPRDFTDPEFVIEGREAEIARTIALGPAVAFHGSIFMPEWSSRLSPQQIQDVVEYLKLFGRR